MSRERPILFSGPMVRAILDGRKTQTRRIIGTTPEWWTTANVGMHSPMPEEYAPEHYGVLFRHAATGADWLKESSYGQPGDRLWVRETWREGGAGSIFYRADEDWNKGAGWKSPRFMPRWASRITLEIVGMRVESVQEISGEDAKAEGVEPFCGRDGTAYRAGFQIIWNEIHGPSAWERNDWVWVIEFKRLAAPAAAKR